MGDIKDKHKKRKKEEGDNDPLSGGLGNRKRDTNDFDIDSETIKDQKNKE